jgi:hypothetical protein
MARKTSKRKTPKPRKESEYRQWAAEWERRRNDADYGAGNWLFEPTDLVVDPGELMATLRVLGNITQDRAFEAARVALAGYDLVDAGGKWKQPAMLASRVTRELCEMIDETIAAGVPERQVFAEAAVEFSIAAASFDAAVERVRVVYKAYRGKKRVRQTR